MGTSKFGLGKSLAYITIQSLGSLTASLLAMVLAPVEFQQNFNEIVGHPQRNPLYNDFQVFLFEFIGSMLYVYMYFANVLDKRAPKNVFGFSIGAVITLCTIAFGAASGACVNPMRIFGAEVFLGFDSEAANYWLAMLSGGVFMAFYYNSFILRTDQVSFEVENRVSDNNMVTSENVNQALNLKF